MKIKKIYNALFTLLLFFGACSDDFLETESTQFISKDKIGEVSEINPELQLSSLSGIYATMYKTGTGGTSLDHDDFGHRGYDIYTDMLSGDMVLAAVNYGWYSGVANLSSTIDYTSQVNYKPWRYYYRIAHGANSVIDALGGSDAIPETEEGKAYLGQAKAMRAYAYFYLVNLFVAEYSEDLPALPIYRNSEVPNQPLSTVREVYDFIEKDLTEAISLLDSFERSAKNEVDKFVAQGLLAYAYAAQGKNSEALTACNAVINANKFDLANSATAIGGFNDISTSGWMWGVDLTTEISLDLVSWFGQVDIFSYSYAWVGDTKVIDLSLYNSIPDNDVRKQQFLNDKTNSYHLAPYKKFYSPERKIGGQRTITTDYVYMRVAEMYLLQAEMSAKTGNESKAKEALSTLLQERIPDASYVNGLSGQDLLDEIYLQTRIELWGEGKSYLAMKRNKKTITRGENHLYHAGKSFAYNAEELTFEIPISEIQNNPNID